MPQAHRCGYLALAGRPNVGKSTLLNALIGQHLSIVSPKAQTTRERVSGVLTGEGYQILVLDAPGLLEPRYALQEAMRWAADAAIREADVIVFLVDVTRPRTAPDGALLEALGRGPAPLIVVLNKVDAVDAGSVDRVRAELEGGGGDVLSVSATEGVGLGALIEHVVPLMPESPPLFPPDDTATQPVRFFAREYVRETCLALFRQEVPYSIACRVDEFREDQEPAYIRITIFVERESQKGIVIGSGGAAIRSVGAQSREKIEALMGRRVFLDLRVKVLPAWSRKRRRLEQLGYRLPPHGRSGQKGV